MERRDEINAGIDRDLENDERAQEELDRKARRIALAAAPRINALACALTELHGKLIGCAIDGGVQELREIDVFLLGEEMEGGTLASLAQEIRDSLGLVGLELI